MKQKVLQETATDTRFSHAAERRHPNNCNKPAAVGSGIPFWLGLFLQKGLARG